VLIFTNTHRPKIVPTPGKGCTLIAADRDRR
jgi:hypothetical protein